MTITSKSACLTLLNKPQVWNTLYITYYIVQLPYNATRLYTMSPFISPISPTILISAEAALATLAFLLFFRYPSTLPTEECLSQKT